MPVDDDDASFDAIGRDAVMSIAVFGYQRAVITSFAQREIVFHLEVIDTSTRRLVAAANTLALVWLAGS